MNTILYCFTGTGNSLQAAEAVAKRIGNAETYPMTTENGLALKTQKFGSVGFVFPVYFGGLPQQVADFLQNLDLGLNQDSYFFTIGTRGGIPANAIRQLGSILNSKGANLDYGRFLHMPDNYILMLNSGIDHSKILEKYAKRIIEIAHEIATGSQRPAKSAIGIVGYYNRWNLKRLPALDAHYHTSDACTGCGICRDICPTGNVKLINGRPEFGGSCQSCVACIQYCPQQALNYKEKTQQRNRYQNQQYTAGDLIAFQRRRWQQQACRT